MRILVVDDEPDLCEILCFNLESEGFQTDSASSAEAAIDMMAQGHHYDLLLLDVMMERMSGYDLARRLRCDGNDVPIIFLTARDSEADLLQGFSAGGDDYITKPFSFPTVLARIQAVLKRSAAAHGAGNENVLRWGPLQVDMDSKSVSCDGMPVALTKKEFLILTLLLQHKDSHFTREQIIRQVWDDDTFIGDRSVDVHIARLRKKLGAVGNQIVNHSGFGYTFQNKT
jgi:DNA-binding response OmpR family regulator